MKKIVLPAEECRILKETDVLVCGGGPAGIAAAISAARKGLDVTLIDEGGCLGGAIPKGMISFTESAIESSGDKQLIGGIWWELMDTMEKMGGSIHGHNLIDHNMYYVFDVSRCEKDLQLPVFEPEIFKATVEKMVCACGIHVLYHTLAEKAIVEGNIVTGVVIDNREGRQVIKAKRVVDATGLAVIAKSAGAECQNSCKDASGQRGSMTVFFRVGGVREVIESYKPNVREIPYGAVNLFPTVRPGEYRVEMTRALGNGMNIDDITKGTMQCRRQIPEVIGWLKSNWPGCENAYLIQSGNVALTFSFLKIIGESTLTQSDMFNGNIPEDVIGLCGYGVDIHSAEEGGQNYLYYFDPGHYYGIGYGSLVPKSKIENILAAGRNISCEPGTEAGVISTPVSMVTGEAAGLACALSIEQDVFPRNLDIKMLQRELLEAGVLLEARPLPGKRKRLNYYQDTASGK